jgi:hypothetical protein
MPRAVPRWCHLYKISDLAHVLLEVSVWWFVEQERHDVRVLQTDDAIWLLVQSKSAGIIMYNVSLDQLFKHLTCTNLVSTMLLASM